MRHFMALSIVLWVPLTARGGGFEVIGLGTEPVGRGGTFTAKADTWLAVEYNVAGLARQRGTRTLLDLNILVSDDSFQRAGCGSHPEQDDVKT